MGVTASFEESMSFFLPKLSYPSGDAYFKERRNKDAGNKTRFGVKIFQYLELELKSNVFNVHPLLQKGPTRRTSSSNECLETNKRFIQG